MFFDTFGRSLFNGFNMGADYRKGPLGHPTREKGVF